MPGAGAVVSLFSANAWELSKAEDRAQPGWCLRLSAPETVRADLNQYWSSLYLLAEVTFATGGVEYTIEIDVAPSAALFVVADTISARLKWQDVKWLDTRDPVEPVPGSVSWSLSRGLSPTTATCSRFIRASSSPFGVVPPFATHFALFSPHGEAFPQTPPPAGDLADLVAMGGGLEFATSDDGGICVQHFVADELLSSFSEYQPIPRGARFWRTPLGLGPVSLMLVFAYGELIA
jgi:hypothetical protein